MEPAVNFYPTTTVAILRGTTTDGYGYEADDNATPVASGILASIIEQTQNTRRQDSDRPSTIRGYICRLPHDTDVRDGDRIKDESDDSIYMLDTITRAANPARAMDWQIMLRKVT